jgi:hypothetical protein
MRPRAMSAGREWEDYDSWFRLRLENDLRLEEIEAEKISRFILSLFLNQENEIDYQREKDLFKYSKTSPNSRSIVVTSRDYIDSKSAMDVAIDELFSIASVDWPPDEIYQVVMEIVTHLKNKIDAGRRKRKISESQSVDSSRSCSSSSSSYEDEFPPINGKQAPSISFEVSSWVPKPDEKEEISEYLPLPQYRFAFKNPKSKSPQSNKKRSPTNKKPKKTNQGKKDAPQKDAIEPKPKKDAIEKDTKADKNVLPKKKEKARKRKRPRKKKNEKEAVEGSPESPQPTPPSRHVESLDNFSSLDEALDFLRDMSASSEDKDAKIWQKVMEDQHVKYVNGSFFFTPRLKNLEINRPIKKDEPDEFLEQAASTALSTVLKIIDDDNEQTQLNSTDIAINYKTYDSKNSNSDQHNQTNQPQMLCNSMIWPNLKKSLSIWTQDQNNAIDWNYT